MMVLVLLDRPEYLNIPYFAMPDPSSRENRFTRLNLNSVSKMVGRRCAAWLTEHRDKVEFITPPFQGNGGAITLVAGARNLLDLQLRELLKTTIVREEATSTRETSALGP